MQHITNKIVTILSVIILASFTVRNDCEKLKNGVYQVEIDPIFKNIYPAFEFTILDGNYIIKTKDSTVVYKINWISNCSFSIKGLTKLKEPLTDFQNKLAKLGEPFYEIIKTKKDTSYFILRRNLDIQIYSGKFILKR